MTVVYRLFVLPPDMRGGAGNVICDIHVTSLFSPLSLGL